MAEVQSIKCPNCGGSVPGEGAVTCPYCGSSLEVKRVDAEQKRAAKRAFGTIGVDANVNPPYIFQNLPGLEITRQTKDIPFQPTVIFSRLPAGEPTGTLREEADAVLDVARRTQDAINREDMDAYMTCVTEADPKFREKARQGAHDQFVTTDMKRYTVAAEFRELTPEKATVTLTLEVFVFFNSGEVNHLQVPMHWRLRKEGGRWVVYGSGIPGAGGGRSILWVSLIIPAIGLIIGLIAAVVGVTTECRNDDGDVVVPDQGDVWKAESRKRPMPDKWFRARSDITLYESPTDDPDVEAVLKAGGEFKLLGYYDGWFHISTKNNTWGWVKEDVIKRNLGAEFKDIPR